ncbi:MAG: sulfotransferase domain-containing protein [Gemmatimonadales bacterium]|nr:sulfotransferase domain-containing protein [Gemmatimonadales bacterium]
MTLGTIALIFVGALVVLVVLEVGYLAVVLAWEDQKTRGVSYYGLPPTERERFKRTLRRHASLLSPILRLLGRVSKPDLSRASFRFEGIAGPKGTCTLESFALAAAYAPEPTDVFVATQMKCGTTWMQHLVYQILMRGRGDLVESGRTLYAISPWLESVKSVSVAEAPIIGTERPSRIIKTHFPARLCPYRPEAKYIYVARHPVSCFASCADFLAGNLGPFCPSLDAIEEWFCSDDLMWWGTWPSHVDGWWHLSLVSENVLFVRFEDMKSDLTTVTHRVAEFLGVEPLTDSELEDTITKCSFDYMRRHEIAFEMHPPHILALDTKLFVRGTADRHRDVSGDAGRHIMEWCANRMKESAFPLAEMYLTRGPGR